MNIQISYLADLEEIPEEVSNRVEKTSTKIRKLADNFDELSCRLSNRSDDGLYKISEMIGELEDKINTMNELQDHLDSYKNLLLNYSKMKRSKKDKEDILNNYGPDSLEVKEMETPNGSDDGTD